MSLLSCVTLSRYARSRSFSASRLAHFASSSSPSALLILVCSASASSRSHVASSVAMRASDFRRLLMVSLVSISAFSGLDLYLAKAAVSSLRGSWVFAEGEGVLLVDDVFSAKPET